MKKLNIGCGEKIKKDYVNLDIIKLPGVDVIYDLEKYPWPFKDNEFDEVYCDNVLEHLNDIIKPMEEIWRITKNDGKIKIIVPMFPSIWAMCDPTHKQFFTYMTFNYFKPEEELYYSKAKFNILKRKFIFPKHFRIFNKIFNLNEGIQKFYYLFLSSFMQAMFLEFELEVVKSS